MNNHLIEFIPDESLGGNRKIISFLVSDIQDCAVSNFGRELTELELHRIEHSFWDNEEAYDLSRDMLHAVIGEVLEDKDVDWTETDKIYYKRTSTNQE